MTRPRNIGWQFSFAALLLLTLFTASGTAADLGIGLTDTRPTNGRYVKTDRGYMIPYKMQIPGTKVTFEMVPVPRGQFMLGSPTDEPGRRAHEGPQVAVEVKPFWIGRYEVTWGEYHHYYDLIDIFRKFEDAGIRKVTKENRADAVTVPSIIYDRLGRMPAVKDKHTTPKYPAVSMTQYAAKQYTKWLSKLTDDFYRLPSESEWEFACRSGSTTAYHFGDDPRKLGEYAWYFDNSTETTQPVGKKKPNAWGIYDMHGNAAEWVLDQFDNKGFSVLGKAIAAGEQPIHWPTKRYPRVARGGSWDNDSSECRSAVRIGSNKDWQEEDPSFPTSPWWLASQAAQNQIGFRIVRPLERPAPKERGKYWDADVEDLRDAIHEYCFENGHSRIGLVDPKLPEAIKRIAKEE
jgi:sulfatase modifying factor 1